MSRKELLQQEHQTRVDRLNMREGGTPSPRPRRSNGVFLLLLFILAVLVLGTAAVWMFL